MEKCYKFSRIEKAILSALQKPAVLDHKILDFINSSLGLHTAEDLQNLFDAYRSSECAAVLELLLFPSHALQLVLEGELEGNGFSPDRLVDLTDKISQASPSLKILLPKDKIAVQFPMQPEHSETFIRRLNLDWSIDQSVKAALAGDSLSDVRYELLVLMRNQRVNFHPASGSFFSQVILEMHAEDKFVDILKMLIGALNQWPSGLSAFEFLSAQKQSYFNQLSKAAQMENYRNQAGFEYVLSSGVRMPYINVEAARGKIALIDKICFSMFGRII